MAYEFKENYINPQSFRQAEVWYDHAGREYQIRTMSKSQALMIIEYLSRRKPAGWTRTCRLMIALRRRVLTNEPAVVGAFNAVESE